MAASYQSATVIQASIRGFNKRTKLRIQNFAATILQTFFRLHRQQPTLQDDDDNADVNSTASHLEEMLLLNNLLCTFNNDFNTIKNDYQQLLDSSLDDPDPVFHLKQANLPIDCYVDSYDKQHVTSYYDVSARRFFDPGGTTFSNSNYNFSSTMSAAIAGFYEYVVIHNNITASSDITTETAIHLIDYLGDMNIMTADDGSLPMSLLIASTRDKQSDHNILWPRHGPDPVFLIEKHDKDPDHIILWPMYAFAIISPPQADAKLATNEHYALPFCVGTSYSAESIRQLFDPGGEINPSATDGQSQPLIIPVDHFELGQTLESPEWVRFTLPHESTDEFEVPEEIIGSSSFSEQYSSMFRKEYDAISHEALQESIVLSEDHVPDFGVMSMEGSDFHANLINDDTPDETLCIDEKFSEESVEVTPNNELSNESLIVQDHQSVGANDNERLLVQTLIQPDEKSLAHDENNDFDPGLPLEQFNFFTPFSHRQVLCTKAVQKQSKMHQWCTKTRGIHFTLKNIENKYNLSSPSKPGMKWGEIVKF